MSPRIVICDSCPHCGGTNLTSFPHERRVVASLRCEDCGATFEMPSARMRPHIGDLVVRHHRSREGFAITLVGASASQETYCASRADAITLATRAARPLSASVWETDDGVTFDLITSYGAYA